MRPVGVAARTVNGTVYPLAQVPSDAAMAVCEILVFACQADHVATALAASMSPKMMNILCARKAYTRAHRVFVTGLEPAGTLSVVSKTGRVKTGVRWSGLIDGGWFALCPTGHYASEMFSAIVDECTVGQMYHCI